MYYFMDSGPKFTGLVWLTAGGTREEKLEISYLSDFGFLVSFRRYSRSKSEVV